MLPSDTNRANNKRMSARDWAILAGMVSERPQRRPGRPFHGTAERPHQPEPKSILKQIERSLGSHSFDHVPQSPANYGRPPRPHMSADPNGTSLPFSRGGGISPRGLLMLSNLVERLSGRSPSSPRELRLDRRSLSPLQTDDNRPEMPVAGRNNPGTPRLSMVERAMDRGVDFWPQNPLPRGLRPSGNSRDSIERYLRQVQPRPSMPFWPPPGPDPQPRPRRCSNDHFPPDLLPYNSDPSYWDPMFRKGLNALEQHRASARSRSASPYNPMLM